MRFSCTKLWLNYALINYYNVFHSFIGLSLVVHNDFCFLQTGFPSLREIWGALSDESDFSEKDDLTEDSDNITAKRKDVSIDSNLVRPWFSRLG